MHERTDGKARRITLTLLVVGVVGALVGVGTLSAFSSSTSNSGNNFDAGTVYITDNDAGSALYNVTNQKPGSTGDEMHPGHLRRDARPPTCTCTRASTIGAVGQYIDLDDPEGHLHGQPGVPGLRRLHLAGHRLQRHARRRSPRRTTRTRPAAPCTRAFRACGTRTTRSCTSSRSRMQDNNNANGQGAGAMQSGSHSFTWEARNQ